MQLHFTRKAPFAHIAIEGRLDTLAAADFDAKMSGIMEEEHLLLLDFSQCQYLSSSGIRSLMIIHKKLASKEQGKLVLVALPPEIKHVLEMAGLHQVFAMAGSLKDGLAQLGKDLDVVRQLLATEDGKWQFECQTSGEAGQTAWLWQQEGIAGQDELGIAAGRGHPAEAFGPGAHGDGLFFTLGHLSAFIPDDASVAPDFHISAEPAQAGIKVNEACSFSSEANVFFRLEGAEPIPWSELLQAIHELSGKINPNRLITGFVIASVHNGWKGLTTGVVAGKDWVKPGNGQPLGFGQPLSFLQPLDFGEISGEQPTALSFAAVTLSMEQLHQPATGGALSVFLQTHIGFESVIGLRPLASDERFYQPVVWLFIGEKAMDAGSKRIGITAPDAFHDEPHKAFLARRLYQDSSRVELKALQGGFSAHTFHVKSWDAQGRKLRPTVLKLAARDMITREAARCKDFAMPYILNNSAMILGTAFFGASGALRYNFVGIGGEESRLQWLTKYFLEWPPEQLQPLFDKIFLQILKPWYGQSRKQIIHPYREHDPTKTFFPDLYQKAWDILGVSADEQHVDIQETGRRMPNPYWALKYRYPEMADRSLECSTSICHGDLNMQNILLDEQMNVYLIDFSETRPRSVVSDFARLEAIFMTEFMPLETESDLKQLVDVLLEFYADPDFEASNHRASGNWNEALRRNLYLSGLMRRYAMHYSDESPCDQPYFLAMLEWVFPVVCYRQANLLQKRFSFILASIMIKKLEISD